MLDPLKLFSGFKLMCPIFLDTHMLGYDLTVFACVFQVFKDICKERRDGTEQSRLGKEVFLADAGCV